jgi:hypothetical protein
MVKTNAPHISSQPPENGPRKGKPFKAVLANQRKARGAKKDPIPTDALEKFQESRKPAIGLVYIAKK